MTVEDLKTFFKEIGYNWTGKIDTCIGSEGMQEPQTFDEVVELCSKHKTGVGFLFLTSSGIMREDYRVLPESFVHYYEYDIGQDFRTMPGKNFTHRWLEFQKALQTKNDL